MGIRMAMAGLLTVLGACSGDGKPDTGYGASQTVPSMENCTDLCQRAADCAGHLCDEDKNTTSYLPLIPALAGECESSCTDAEVSSGVTSSQWQCVFTMSCRQVFGEGACGTANTYYTCQ